MSDIIDNLNGAKLAERLNTFLESSQMARFAVGYFFLSGFEALAERLAGLDEVRLLIGNVSNAQTIEQLAEGYRHLGIVQRALANEHDRPRRLAQSAAQDTAENIREALGQLDQTDQAVQTAQLLMRLISEGRLHVRIYTRGRLHAKAYIFTYGQVYAANGQPIQRDEQGVAVVGSSNLSLAGIQHNTELNVVVRGNDNHADLVAWFEALWADAEAFDQTLMHELQESWAGKLATPYEVYMKALYSLVSDRLEEGEKGEIIWDDELTSALTNFQKVAVRQAIQMIRDYGGAFVSDVVGLGKSFIGAAIVKHFARTDNARSLVICPAPLLGMWRRYSEVYGLNAEVVSMGKLLEHGDPTWLQRTYPNRDFVLVDESHNLRHRETQRYRVLQAFMGNGGKRACLLTATPRNQSAWDVYHQIKLFHGEDRTLLPITPANLREYFNNIEAGTRTLPELLRHILVRRTRLHVLRWYGFDAETDEAVDPTHFQPYLDGTRRAYVKVGGRRQFFPQRILETVEYSIEATYQGLYERLRAYIGRGTGVNGAALADELTYARYGLWWYVRPERRSKQPYVGLQRAGANLRGLIRIMLFKRFESSVYAFRETVRRLLKVHRLFLDALAEGYVPAGEQAQRLLYESDFEDEAALAAALDALEGQYDIADFDAQRLTAHLRHDVAILEQILELVEPIQPQQDAKLQTLKARLADAPLHGNKCLIFTQYADTARYLYEQLNPEGDKRIEVIYSNNRDKAALVGRFAPFANPEQQGGANDVEIQTLIATDVLAEGLNLQDCNLIINYDLHWNPVRLIQRFGRVDRIGTEHEAIYGFNFLPEVGIEANLGLRERLGRRIQEIHDTIGEDAVILERSEHLNPEAFYAIYEQRVGALGDAELDEDAEFLSLSEAEEMLRQMRAEDKAAYERIVNLRNGIRSAMPSSERQGYFVLLRAGRFQQAFLLNAAGELVSREINEVLRAIQCAPETPTGNLPHNYNQIVMRAKERFAQEVAGRLRDLQSSETLTQGQKYVLEQLRLQLNDTQDDERRRQIVALESAFRQAPTQALNRELNLLRRNGVRGEALFNRLIEFYYHHDLSNLAARRAMQSERESVPIIVCSEAL